MIDLHKLLKLSYLLDPRPDFSFQFLIPLTVIFALCLIAGIILWLIKPIRQKVGMEELTQWLRWLGSLGLILNFARYEGLEYLAIRLNYFILGFGFLIWLLLIARNIRARGPELSEQTIRQETYEKYLPQAKRQR